MLTVVVIITIIVGSFSTFGESRIRGALAFQMVAGVGQILIGLVVLTEFSLAAGLFYMVHHMITMAGLVLASRTPMAPDVLTVCPGSCAAIPGQRLFSLSV